MTAASNTAALVWALNTRLIAGATATETLLAWCEEHGLSEGPITVEIRQCFAPAVVPDDVLPALKLDPGETIHYRQVRLMRGPLPLAAAENWFVPQRLTADMNEALIQTNVPFGRVIAPLRPLRRTLAADLQPHAEIILRHRAVVLSNAGTALALVKENYFSDLVSFASAPSPLHRPVSEGLERSKTQNVSLAR
jgi:chorismate-pyruvate lyase